MVIDERIGKALFSTELQGLTNNAFRVLVALLVYADDEGVVTISKEEIFQKLHGAVGNLPELYELDQQGYIDSHDEKGRIRILWDGESRRPKPPRLPETVQAEAKAVFHEKTRKKAAGLAAKFLKK